MHSTRAGDVCARIGGDEFLVVLEYNTPDIRPVISRIFKSVCGEIGDFSLTVSMGVAEMKREGQEYKELFRKADIALYASKRAGRAQCSFYDESMGDEMPD